MALFNYAARELTLKIVYYGPGMSGKTTNLQHLHRSIQPEKRGKLLSLATETDRTLFFDFLPVNIGKINDFDVRFQLYTVPGQVQYNATRRLVLKGVDAVVFVADSQRGAKPDNDESFGNMFENLKENGLDPARTPIVLQYNKRDLDGIMPQEEMEADLNKRGYPVFLASAVNGRGVHETFKAVINILLANLARRRDLQSGKTKTGQAAAANSSAPAAGDETGHSDFASARQARDTVNHPKPEKIALREEPPEIAPPPRAPSEDINTAIEEVRGALSALSAKLDAISLDLKARPAPPGPAQVSETDRDAALSALSAEISNLSALLESENKRWADKKEKDGGQELAQTDELLSLSRKTRIMMEESLLLLRQLPDCRKKKGFFSRLFG